MIMKHCIASECALHLLPVVAAAVAPPTPQLTAALQSAASAPIATLPSGFGSAGNLQRAVSRKLSVSQLPCPTASQLLSGAYRPDVQQPQC